MLSRGEVRGLDRINVDTGLADRRPSLLLIRQNVHTALPLNPLVSVVPATACLTKLRAFRPDAR